MLKARLDGVFNVSRGRVAQKSGVCSGSGRLDLAPVPTDSSVLYSFLSIGIPEGLSRFGLWACGLAYVGVLVAVARRLLAYVRAIELLPTAMLVLLQAVWFAIPSLLVLSGGRPSGS